MLGPGFETFQEDLNKAMQGKTPGQQVQALENALQGNKQAKERIQEMHAADADPSYRELMQIRENAYKQTAALLVIAKKEGLTEEGLAAAVAKLKGGPEGEGKPPAGSPTPTK
jgi:hypothetical protein